MLVEPQFSIFCIKCFLHFDYQKCFFISYLPNIQFFEHFLQIGHNFRIINGQNNVSSEVTRKLDILEKMFQAMRTRTSVYVDQNIGQLTKVGTPRRRIK